MGWAGRLFDARDTFVRMLLLDASGVSYLVFGTQAGHRPTGLQLLLAAVAFASALAFHLRPLVALLRGPEGVRGDAALTAIEPSALPAALGAAVDTARRSGLVVDADISPSVGQLDAARGLAVLRLTQEALTNVAKHAGPSARARLSVAVLDGDVRWEGADDGGTGR